MVEYDKFDQKPVYNIMDIRSHTFLYPYDSKHLTMNIRKNNINTNDNRLNGAQTWELNYFDIGSVLERPQYVEKYKRSNKLYSLKITMSTNS